MDNVTHLLVGVLVAEVAVCLHTRSRARSQDAPGFRKAAYVGSLLCNNLPDFDFLYAWGHRPLGYLLHHRGHTHTLPVALLLGVLGFGLVRWFARVRRWQLDARDSRWLLGICLLGGLLHIALDSANNYGVHPFWPFYNGWFYGDSFFIIEPFFWAALVAPLIWSIQRRSLKILLGAVLLLGIGLCWFGGLVPRSMALSVTGLALLLAVLSRKLGKTARAGLATAAFALLGLLFIGSSAQAKKRVSARALEQFPDSVTRELVLTPMPANPFCWNVLLVQTRGTDYVVRRGAASTFPGWFSSAECRFETEDHGTASGTPLKLASSELRWTREYALPIAKLRKLSNEHCRLAAFLHFSRVPFVANHEEHGPVALDLRFDRNSDVEFAEFSLNDGRGCPEHVPPWIPPRSELIQ